MSFNKIFTIIVNFLPIDFFSIPWGLGTEHSREEMKVKNFEEKNLKVRIYIMNCLGVLNLN